MQDEWIPFLEAIHRMHDRLFLADFRAKPLLRSAVASGRVCGRGEYKERGQIIFTRYGENLGDENVIHEGSLCYKVEVYPGEVVLAELRSWMDSLSDDSPLLRPFIVPPQQIDSSLAGGGHGGEAQEGASGSVTRDGQPESSAHAAEAATAESPPSRLLKKSVSFADET